MKNHLNIATTGKCGSKISVLRNVGKRNFVGSKIFFDPKFFGSDMVKFRLATDKILPTLISQWWWVVGGPE